MERIPQWKDIPKDFTPKTTEYYQKQQGYRPITNPSIIQKSSYNQSKVKQPSTMNTIRLADRQKLTQLVQCLAISETQRKHLEASINEISQQKQTLNDQLNILMQEKTKWIQSETTSKLLLEESKAKLQQKEFEIQQLLLKLTSYESSLKSAPATNESKPSEVVAWEQKLNVIQAEISKLTDKIQNLSNGEFKLPVKTTEQHDNVSMNKQNQPNLVPERKSEKGNTVSLSDDISSSLDISKSEPVTTTNLESLLKKLLKGKRVRYESNLDSEDYSSLHNIIKDNAVDESDDSTTSFSHFEPFIKSTKHKDKNTIEKKKKLHNLRSFDDVPQRYIDDLNKPKRKDMNTSTTELKTVHHRSTSPVKIQNEMKSRLLSKKIGEDQPIRFDRSTQNSFRNSIIEKINSFNNSASDKLMRSELHDTAPEPALLYSQADTNLENIRQRKKKTVPRTDSHTINQHKGHNQSTSISYNHVHRHIPTPSSPVKVMEPVSTSDFSCTCPTCSSQSISWVCPGCVSDVSNSTNPLKNIPNPGILTPDSSHIKANPSASLNVSMIPKDSSILFANDTSMIKSLMDVVSEIESSPLKWSGVNLSQESVVDFECEEELLDVISSLNGMA